MNLEKLVSCLNRGDFNEFYHIVKSNNSKFARKLTALLDEYHSILSQHPDEVVSQLYAKINGKNDEELEEFVSVLVERLEKPWLQSLFPIYSEGFKSLRTFHEHYDFVGSIVPLSDRQFVSSSEDARMILWEFEDSHALRILEDHESAVNFMAKSPVGPILASASDDYTIKLWNTKDMTIYRTLEGHSDYISKVAITRTDRVVSVSKDQTVKVWDLSNGKCLHTLTGHNAWVYMLAVSPDGNRAITSSVNGTMIVWDIMNGQPSKTIYDGGTDVHYVMDFILDSKNETGIGHESYPVSALWLDDGRVITAAEDIIVWDDTEFNELMRLPGHPWKIHGLVTIKNNTILISAAQSIKGWDLSNGKELFKLIGHDGEEIYSAAIAQEEKYLLTGDKTGKIKIWEIDQFLTQQVVTGHLGYAHSLRISPSKNIAATGGYDKTCILWSLRTGLTLHYLNQHDEMGVKVIGFLNEGQEVVTSERGKLHVWDTETGEEKTLIICPNNLYELEAGLILPGEEEIFGATMSYRPSLWSLKDRTVEFYNSDFCIYSELRLAKDGRFIIGDSYPSNLLDHETEDDATEQERDESPIMYWDLNKKKFANQFWVHQQDKISGTIEKIYPSKVEFDLTDQFIIGGFSNGILSVWDRKIEEPIYQKSISSEYITDLFLTNDNQVITRSKDSSKLKIWSIPRLDLVSSIQLPGSSIYKIQTSGDNQLMAYRRNEYTCDIFDFVNKKLITSFTFSTKIRDLRLIDKQIYVTTDAGYLHGFELVR